MALVSRSHKFIYVSGGKCATGSIHSALKNSPGVQGYEPARVNGPKSRDWKKYNKHMLASVIKKRVGDEVWNESFKFSFVRNPYAWVVSSFFFMVKKKMLKMPKNKIMTIKDFKDTLAYYKTPAGRRHDPYSDVRSQHSFLCDENQNLLVDFVGKVENLQPDFNKVCNRIGIPKVQLETRNKSESSKNPYRIHYNEESKKFVEKYWGRDINAFKYEF